MEVENVMAELERLKEDLFSGKAINFMVGRHKTRLIGRGYRIKKINSWKRGDPFRSIDWKLSLRTWPDEIYKLEKTEPKEVPICLVLDSSPSTLIRFADEESKFLLTMRLMAVLGYAGLYFGDPVAISSFGQVVNFFLPFRYGRSQIFNAVQMMVDGANDFYEAIEKQKLWNNPGPDINESLAMVLARIKRQSVVFVISDLMDVMYGQKILDIDILSALIGRHKRNVIFLITEDQNEFSWQNSSGTIMTKDIETGRLGEVKANQASAIRADLKIRQASFQKQLEDIGIDSLVISSDDYLSKLVEFVTSRKTVFNKTRT